MGWPASQSNFPQRCFVRNFVLKTCRGGHYVKLVFARIASVFKNERRANGSVSAGFWSWGSSWVSTPAGLSAQNLLKVGSFPLKLPNTCMILKKKTLGGRGPRSPGSASGQATPVLVFLCGEYSSFCLGTPHTPVRIQLSCQKYWKSAKLCCHKSWRKTFSFADFCRCFDWWHLDLKTSDWPVLVKPPMIQLVLVVFLGVQVCDVEKWRTPEVGLDPRPLFSETSRRQTNNGCLLGEDTLMSDGQEFLGLKIYFPCLCPWARQMAEGPGPGQANQNERVGGTRGSTQAFNNGPPPCR